MMAQVMHKPILLEMKPVRLVPAILWVIIVSCSDSPGNSTAAFTRVDSAGISIVTNFRIADRHGYSLEETPLTVIGADNSDTNQQFTRIPMAIRINTDVVTATSNGAVAVFDESGAFLKSLIRPGRGPGELTSVGRLISSGDTLIVRGGGRILRFSMLTKSLLSDERHVCPQGNTLWNGTADCSQEFFGDGWAITIRSDSSIPFTATNRPDKDLGHNVTSPGPGHLRQFHRIYALPPARDTAYPLGLNAGIEQTVIVVNPERLTSIVHSFYSFRSYQATNGNPRAFAVALNPDYNVEVWNDRGHLTHIIRRTNGRRVPTGDEHIDARKYLELQLEGEMTVDKALEQMPVPDSLPAITGLSVSPHGDVVVQTAGWRIADTSSVFDVFDKTGIWVAQWNLPRRARISEIGNDYVLYIRLNEDDVALVEVRRTRDQRQ